MSAGMIGDNRVPLVRLNLFMPLVVFLEEEGVKPDGMLETHGSTRLVVEHSDMFIQATKMCELVEGIVEASADPYFGVHAAERLVLENTSPFARGVKIGPALAAPPRGNDNWRQTRPRKTASSRPDG